MKVIKLRMVQRKVVSIAERLYSFLFGVLLLLNDQRETIHS